MKQRGTLKLGISFEYVDQKAFKDCHTLLEKPYFGKLTDFTTKIVAYCGVIVPEFYSEDFK